MSGVRRLSDQALIGAGAGASSGQILSYSGTGHYAPASGTRWEPRLTAYNFSEQSLSLYRAALARVRSAGAGNFARIYCVGDSITRGVNANNPTWANSYPARLTSYLAGQAGVNYYTGMIWAAGNAQDSTASAWWTSDGTTWQAVALDSGTGGFAYNWLQNSTNGAGQLVFHVTNADTVRLYTLTDTNSHQFTYSVDGAAAVNGPAAGGTQYVNSYTTISLGSVGAHTVAINAPASGNAYILGAEAYIAANSGVLVSNWGIGNAKASDLGTTTGAYNGLTRLVNASPDLVFLMFGTNEAIGAVAPATYQANISAIVTAIRAVNSDVILMVPPNRCSTSTTFTADAAYNSALYNVSDALNVPLIDLTRRWPSTFTGVTTAPYSLEPNGGVHPTDKGYADIAQAVRNVLAAAG